MGKEKYDIQQIIREAVSAGLVAGGERMAQTASDAYKKTEKRLYAYPVLRHKIQVDAERLREIKEGRAPGKSKDIVRFQRTGYRLSQEEIQEGLLKNMEARIAIDEHETNEIALALKNIQSDVYYKAVTLRYFSSANDDTIAEVLNCDTSTVRRNRARLVRQLAIWLYGSTAI